MNVTLCGCECVAEKQVPDLYTVPRAWAHHPAALPWPLRWKGTVPDGGGRLSWVGFFGRFFGHARDLRIWDRSGHRQVERGRTMTYVYVPTCLCFAHCATGVIEVPWALVAVLTIMEASRDR